MYRVYQMYSTVGGGVGTGAGVIADVTAGTDALGVKGVEPA